MNPGSQSFYTSTLSLRHRPNFLGSYRPNLLESYFATVLFLDKFIDVTQPPPFFLIHRSYTGFLYCADIPSLKKDTMTVGQIDIVSDGNRVLGVSQSNWSSSSISCVSDKAT